MKSSSSTDFTASDGHRFAFPVGIAFLVLAGVLWWRGRTTPMWVVTTLGGVLILAGTLVPARLGPIYRAWMGLALLISKVTTPIFMAVVYFLVFTPAGWVMRAFGRRPITHSPKEGSFWRTPPSDRGPGDLRRQF